DTEASILPLKISEGVNGLIKIRDGMRVVYLNFFTIFTFYMNVQTVFRHSLIAQIISETNSFFDANKLLKERGIITEYELQLKKAKRKS
ncbi:MAG: DUF1152 domain-containing protein, partial [Candidatus Odinarchaeia archaeon]